jgi:hypothetical protein
MEIDELYQYSLAHYRAQRRELDEIKDASKEVKPPSKLKYASLFVMSASLDIVDWLGLTGIGLILTYALKIVFAPILFMAGWGANSRIKEMNKFKSKAFAHIEAIEKRIIFYARNYQRALKLARRYKFLRKPVRKVALRIARARKTAVRKVGQIVSRNPLMKNMAAIIADFIPLIDIIPWRTLGIYLTYRDEKKTFEETQPVAEELANAKAEELETAGQYRESLLEQEAEEAEEREEEILESYSEEEERIAA